jgi:SIR2-like domain
LEPQESALNRLAQALSSRYIEVGNLAKQSLEAWKSRQTQVKDQSQPLKVEPVSPKKQNLEEKDWHLLLRRIRDGRCTPLIGAGANYGILPLGSDIAREWSQRFNYPESDTHNLVRVAQYTSVLNDPLFPKEELLHTIRNVERVKLFEPDNPLGVLAHLPLPIYITTNYDDLMEQALRSLDKAPVTAVCQWNDQLRDILSSKFESKNFIPTPAEPVVFHVYGFQDFPESLVLTEDDHFDFLVNISKTPERIPPRIWQALSSTSLLPLGYSAVELGYRVLSRSRISSISRSFSRLSVQVFLPPSPEQGNLADFQMNYFARYFADLGVRIYWGTPKEFAVELRVRWESYGGR